MKKITKEQLIQKVLSVMTKDKWTRYTMARDKYRHPVPFDSDRAVKLCVSGWCQRIEKLNGNSNVSSRIFLDFVTKYKSLISNTNGYIQRY